MSENDRQRSVNPDVTHPNLVRTRRDSGADWGSWIDPNDPRDAVHINKTENTGLRARIRDLSRENDEMNSMLEGTGIATVFLDRELNVLRFNTAASRIHHSRMVAVKDEVRSVRETLRSKRVDIEATDGHWYRMHAHPHRTLTGEFGGVVLSFFDITEQRKADSVTARRLAEKDTLLKEVHHRVRNNMTSIVGLLSTQAESIGNPEARSVLRGAIGRMESMSVLYDKLLVSEQYGTSSAQQYLCDLADGVLACYSQRPNVKMEKRVSDFDLASDTLFVLGLITNELLTNAIKYAFSDRTDGLIRLILERSKQGVTLMVEDNGVGFSAEFDSEQSNGYGLSLVRMLSEQLGGSFSIAGRNGSRGILRFTP
jgi:two-component sensor histidine kinase